MKKTVALAISGGIDSAVSAYLLKELGYEVLGIHYKFWTWANASSDLQDTKNKYINNFIGSHFFSVHYAIMYSN